MLNRMTKAVGVTGVAALLATAAMSGASAHVVLEDDGVIDSG